MRNKKLRGRDSAVTAPLGMLRTAGQTGKAAAFDLYLLHVCFAFKSFAERKALDTRKMAQEDRSAF